MIQYRDFDVAKLERFKQLQRRAYATLEEIAATLRTGESEPQADALLCELRALILARTRERRSMREIAREADGVITSRGFENCHRKHIGKVLAHRMAHVTPAWLASRRIWGLSPLPVIWFFWRSYRSFRNRPQLTPNWNHTRQCDCPPQPSLWAMEPHVALGALGAKFEEILVVTGDDAYYLDEDLPHHRRWAAAGLPARPA